MRGRAMTISYTKIRLPPRREKIEALTAVQTMRR